MSRYSFRNIVCSILLFWGLVSPVFADVYTIGFLRGLNPSLWDQLGLNQRFPDQNQPLVMMDDFRWQGLLKEIVLKLEARAAPVKPSGRLGAFYAMVARKPTFDPALFPVLWLAFRDVREALPFAFRDDSFLQQLRDFQVVTFLEKLNWPSVDLSDLSLLGATLNGHVFMWTILNNVNFSGAILIGCHFLNCVLHNAILTLAAELSTTRFTFCQDSESKETALMLYKTQANECVGDDKECALKRSRLLLQQARCLLTSGDEDYANAILSTPPEAGGAMVQYIKMLIEFKMNEVLIQLMNDSATFAHVHPAQYRNDPETVLRLAWALYVLMHRGGVSDQCQDELWNMLVIGLVGIEMPDTNARIPLGNTVHTAPQANLGYQAALLEFLNSHGYRAVAIDKDDSCFYSAVAHHMPQASMPNAGSAITRGDWLRQVLGLLYLQCLIQQGCSAEQLSGLVDPEVYSAVATFAEELPASKHAAIQSNPLLAANTATSMLQNLITPQAWASDEFGSLAAILLNQPVFQIQMQHQEFLLQQNHPNGSVDFPDEIFTTPDNSHPLLVIYSGHSHWLTALIPIMLIMSQPVQESGDSGGQF